MNPSHLFGPDTLAAMRPDLVFDYWGVHLNREKAAGKKLVIGFDFTDINEQHTLTLDNGVLTQSAPRAAEVNARLAMTKAAFDRLQSGQTTLDDAIKSGTIGAKGRSESANELIGLLDGFPYWFDIVTP